MLSVDEARERLLSGIRATESETVLLADALGRVPAERAIVAAHDVPPFANSAMDGFAVRAADGDSPRRLIGESRAGAADVPVVEPGTAVRITTGAPLPAGADAIVPVEEASTEDGSVVPGGEPLQWSHVRAAGHDVAAGSSVPLPEGPITPSTIGLLAAIGISRVAVRRRPRVAVLSTGDELAEAGAPLAPGQIHDANGPALAAAVTEAGGEAIVLERVADDPGQVERRVREAATTSDMLVVSGGVSVGEHDHVRGVIQRLGALDFWRIAVQPGKPLAYGHVGRRPVVGLPGNPVSALVTFEIFVRPMLRRMLGLAGDGRLRVWARTDEKLPKDIARRAYLRVRVAGNEDGYVAVSAGGQASSQLLPLASANGLLVVPEGLPATRPGRRYEAILLGPVE